MNYPIINLRSRIFYIPLILGSLVASFYLISIIGTFLLQFSFLFEVLIAAWIISVVLEPIVSYLKKNEVPTALAILSSFIILFCVLVIVGVTILPPLFTQLNIAAAHLSSVDVNGLVRGLMKNLNIKGFESINISSTFVTQINSVIYLVLNNGVTVVTNLITTFVGFILALFFAYYFLSEGSTWKAYLLDKMPAQYKPDFVVISDAINEGIQGFIKGQTIVALLIAICTMVPMWIMGLNFVVVAGLYAFICMYIPIIGPTLAMIVPLIIAATTSVPALIILFIILFVISQIVLNIIQPKIFSRSLGLHPVLVLVSVLIGAQLFGLVGALLALPFASIIQAILIHYYK